MKSSARWLACLLFVSSATPLFAQSALDRLEEQVRAGENPTTEAEDSSYLGAVADDANEKLRGVRLLELKPGGPADQQGLQAGDLVTAIGGDKVATLDQFADRLAKIPVGEKADFSVERGGEKLSIPVQLGKRAPKPAGPITGPIKSGPALPVPAERAPAGPTRPSASPVATVQPPVAAPATNAPAAENSPRTAPLGIRLAPVDEAARIAQGQPVLRGGVITFVASGSTAERAGLKVDDVIFAIDGAKIDTPDDAVRALGKVKAGQVVKLAIYQHGDRIELPITIEAFGSKPNAEASPTLGEARRTTTPADQTPRPFSQGPIASDPHARISELERNLADLQQRLAALEATIRKFERDTGIAPAAPPAPEEKPE
jgi:S1-C subfamily serine protease